MSFYFSKSFGNIQRSSECYSVKIILVTLIVVVVFIELLIKVISYILVNIILNKLFVFLSFLLFLFLLFLSHFLSLGFTFKVIEYFETLLRDIKLVFTILFEDDFFLVLSILCELTLESISFIKLLFCHVCSFNTLYALMARRFHRIAHCV